MDKVKNILVIAASVVAAAKVIADAVGNVVKDVSVYTNPQPKPND